MTDLRAGIRRRRATTAWAAALVVVLGGAVTSSGAERSGREDKRSQGAELAFKDPLGTSYLRYFKESEREWMAGYSDPFYVNLAASRLSPGKGSVSARNIKVTVDLSAVKAVRFDTAKGMQGCKRSGDLVTCTPKNIAAGDHADLWLFSMSPGENAAKGPAGSMNVTVASSNAPTIHYTTQLVIGTPVLTAREERDSTSGSAEPGNEVSVRPAFGNEGAVGVDDDLSVVVDVKGQATLRRQYSNCRYDKADAPKKAVCMIPGPLPVGAAYETDQPFTVAIDKSGSQGKITYTLYPAPNTPTRDLLHDSAPRGTGAPLGFRPTDGSHFKKYDRDSAFDEWRFRTSRTHDAQVNGFTIKGRVGHTTNIEVVDEDGLYEGDTWLTLPEGTSLDEERDMPASEMLYCHYVDKGRRRVLCPAPEITPPTLRVHVDKRVEGAQGTISVGSDPQDPDPTNNTAPITMEYVD